MNSITEKDVLRFWGHVDKESSNTFYNGLRCFEWTGDRIRNNYGRIYMCGRKELAHRVAWVLAYGEISDGLNVLHHCDNPGCVRFEHLFLGTQLDNAKDMENKGRGNKASGDKHGSRTHPESLPRGDNHWSHLHPEKYQRGDNHYSRRHPEKLVRGDNHYSRLHPEKLLRGEDHGNAKLTWEKVREIRRRYAWLGIGGDSAATLAKEFGVNKGTIRLIVMNKTWKD